MPVNYPDILSQIDSMCARQPALERERSRRLEQAFETLHAHAYRLAELNLRVDQALDFGRGLRCARPLDEPLTHAFGPPPAAQAVPTILASDGSQISPSRHERVFFGLVNTGIFRIFPSESCVPEEEIFSELYFPDPFNPDAEPLSEEMVAFRRDLRERIILAEQVAAWAAPVVALTDGPLELHRDLLDHPRTRPLLNEYLARLEPLADRPVVTAGFVERPRSDLVVRLLELAVGDPQLPPDQQRIFFGLTDQHLFSGLLEPGQRSAVFSIQSSPAEFFHSGAGGDLSLRFFYLNVGSARRPALARVELHTWSARQPWLVNLLHGTLLDQCACLGERPYPYALLRAHEVALVRRHEREQIENWIINGEMEAWSKAGLERYDYSQTSKQLGKNDIGIRGMRLRRYS